jgi:hypothetical protein
MVHQAWSRCTVLSADFALIMLPSITHRLHMHLHMGVQAWSTFKILYAYFAQIRLLGMHSHVLLQFHRGGEYPLADAAFVWFHACVLQHVLPQCSSWTESLHMFGRGRHRDKTSRAYFSIWRIHVCDNWKLKDDNMSIYYRIELFKKWWQVTGNTTKYPGIPGYTIQGQYGILQRTFTIYCTLTKHFGALTGIGQDLPCIQTVRYGCQIQNLFIACNLGSCFLNQVVAKFWKWTWKISYDVKEKLQSLQVLKNTTCKSNLRRSMALHMLL